jgi:WD40 repeat protein
MRGFTGKGRSTLHAYPMDPESYITWYEKNGILLSLESQLSSVFRDMDSMGAAVVIGNVHESHKQELLRGHEEEINIMAVGNTGGMLASAQIASCRHQVRSSGLSPQTILGTDPSEFNQDQGAAIIVWDLANRHELYRLTGFQKSVIQLAFSPDDHFLVASSEDCRILLWDMRVRLKDLTACLLLRISPSSFPLSLGCRHQSSY